MSRKRNSSLCTDDTPSRKQWIVALSMIFFIVSGTSASSEGVYTQQMGEPGGESELGLESEDPALHEGYDNGDASGIYVDIAFDETPTQSGTEAPPSTLKSFDQWAADAGFAPTAEQQEMLDRGQDLMGVVPESELPIRHASGSMEVGEATYEALLSGELNYLEDFESWVNAGLFDPTLADQVREARRFPEVVEWVDWEVPPVDSDLPGYPTESEHCVEGDMFCEPEVDPAPTCDLLLGVAVKSSRKSSGTAGRDDYCSWFSGESEAHTIHGAQVLSDSTGGAPHDGWGKCTSKDSASGGSRLQAQLILMDREEGSPGDCPAASSYKMKVPVDLYAGIRARVNAKSDATYFPLQVLNPFADSFKEIAFAQVSSDGTDLDPYQGTADVSLASDCTTTYSFSGNVELDNAGASVGVSKTCSGDAINENKSMKTKAVSIGSTDLFYNYSGSTDTSLTVSADYQTHAESVGCADGSGFWGCYLLTGSARVNTERYCLEVEADGYCEVVPAMEGVTCDVDGGAMTASLGSCF